MKVFSSKLDVNSKSTIQAPVLEMFAARHSNGLYLATSARVWIVFGVRIFTFLTDICRVFFQLLTLPDAEFNSVSDSFTKT